MSGGTTTDVLDSTQIDLFIRLIQPAMAADFLTTLRDSDPLPVSTPTITISLQVPEIQKEAFRHWLGKTDGISKDTIWSEDGSEATIKLDLQKLRTLVKSVGTQELLLDSITEALDINALISIHKNTTLFAGDDLKPYRIYFDFVECCQQFKSKCAEFSSDSPAAYIGLQGEFERAARQSFSPLFVAQGLLPSEPTLQRPKSTFSRIMSFRKSTRSESRSSSSSISKPEEEKSGISYDEAREEYAQKLADICVRYPSYAAEFIMLDQLKLNSQNSVMARIQSDMAAEPGARGIYTEMNNAFTELFAARRELVVAGASEYANLKNSDSSEYARGLTQLFEENININLPATKKPTGFRRGSMMATQVQTPIAQIENTVNSEKLLGDANKLFIRLICDACSNANSPAYRRAEHEITSIFNILYNHVFSSAAFTSQEHANAVVEKLAATLKDYITPENLDKVYNQFNVQHIPTEIQNNNQARHEYLTNQRVKLLKGEILGDLVKIFKDVKNDVVNINPKPHSALRA